jgi:ClpP class serine protease
VCLGQAASAAAVLLAAGTKGKRLALPNSRILIHQPYTEGTYGQSSDLEIQANEILRMRSLLEEMLAENSGKSAEEVSRDVERDKILTAQQAVEYGLVDNILESLKPAADDLTFPEGSGPRSPTAYTSRSVPGHEHPKPGYGRDIQVWILVAIRHGGRGRDIAWHASAMEAICSSARSAERARSRSRS